VGALCGKASRHLLEFDVLQEDLCSAIRVQYRDTYQVFPLEVIVTCFDRYIVEHLHRVVMIEGDHVASLCEGDEVDANCFSAVEWLLVPAS
jgi:hypothetical protein